MNRKTRYVWVLHLLMLVSAFSAQAQGVEHFDSLPLSSVGQAILAHPLTHLVKKEGLESSNAIKVNYKGFERGSRRVVVSAPIGPADQYTLSFWVRFCEGFDFARGGKLHGLGPVKPVAGGHAVSPDGWSARLMFRKEGGLQTYVYHQDMKAKYGDTKIAQGFIFEPDRYYHVAMQVKLNQPAKVANGFIKVWVDEKLLIEHKSLRFRDRITPESKIQRLLFNTFHGGNSPDWAPRNDEGAYKTDCAFFDDVELMVNY